MVSMSKSLMKKLSNIQGCVGGTAKERKTKRNARNENSKRS